MKLTLNFFTLIWMALLLIGISVATVACKKTEKTIPTLNFESSISQQEGTETPNQVTIAFSLSNDYDENVVVLYQTIDGTAVDGVDYTGIAEGELTFAPGETSKEIQIALLNDDIFEDNKSFSLVINKATNAKPAQSICNITILNDDVFTPEVILPGRARRNEGQANGTVQLTVKLNGAATGPVSIKWSTVDGSAKAGTDYVASLDNTLTFNPGEIQKNIEVETIGDASFEYDEGFFIHFSDVQNATFVPEDVVVVLDNDDSFTVEMQDDGPITPLTYEGFNLIWQDEFDGTTINTDNWGYDIGGGGWGNQEWQTYTSSPTNSFVQDGKLNIVATKLYASYNSARLLSKNKKTFTYGRIDFRAKMPFGKGIWPALWMLGNNISSVGWPRCGEIDIMEYLGHITTQVHGTVHYNKNGHQYTGDHYTLTGGEGFDDKFHVFTILWSEYGIRWYVDYQPYFQVEDTDIEFSAFKLPQFFIMNVAVGGVWPGYPDETTTFPQTMMVDYVRVFQPAE